MKQYTEIEKNDSEQINHIGEILFQENNNWDKIYSQLKSIYDRIPENYQNNFEEDGKLYYKFWDLNEFQHYCEIIKPQKDVIWIGNAYLKCCYFLSIISIERGDFDTALKYLERGLKLEPDNPNLLSEVGLLFSE